MKPAMKLIGGLASVLVIAVLATSYNEKQALPPYGFIAADQGECVTGKTHLYPGAPVAKGPAFRTPEQAFNAQATDAQGSYRRRDISSTHVVFEKLENGQPIAFVTVRDLPGQGWNVTDSQEKAACGSNLDKGEYLGS
jgi:hypothetical protein